MLVELLILILGAGLISELVPKNRLPVLWSLFSAAAVSYFVYRLSLLGNAPDLYLNCPWLKIPNLAVNLEIVVNAGNIYLVFALSILALLVLLQNTFGAENAKNSLNGLVLLNLLSSLMLVFAGNYVQMLVAVGVCDVLVFSAVNNIEAKKKYIYANFLADIGLVSIFAVILGQRGGLELDKLPDYARFGHHKDFVAILLLLCIFVKTGLFLFHGAYTEMRTLGFNRLNYVLFTATPLTGYLLLLKTESLLQISPFSYPLLKIFALSSVLWGVWGALAIDNLKQKAVYFALMFWGLVYAFAAFGSRLDSLQFASLLTAAFLFGQVLMLICAAASNETQVSETGGFLKSLKFTFLLALLVLAAFFSVLFKTAEGSPWLAGGYALLFAAASAHVLSQILLGESRADERVQAMLKNPPLPSWLPVAAAAAVLCWSFRLSPLWLTPLLAAWLGLFFLRPLRRLDALYDNDVLQEADYVGTAYELLIITPVKVIGRLLWLTVDFVFIERTIISSVQNALGFMIFLFRRIHSGTVTGMLLFMLLGFAVIGIVWLYGG